MGVRSGVVAGVCSGVMAAVGVLSGVVAAVGVRSGVVSAVGVCSGVVVAVGVCSGVVVAVGVCSGVVVAVCVCAHLLSLALRTTLLVSSSSSLSRHRPAQTTAAQLNTVTQNHPLTNWVTIN